MIGIAWLVAVGGVLGCSGSEIDGTVPVDSGTTQAEACATGGGELPVGPCLVAAFAGTYSVTATTSTHVRGTVVITEDGDVDYDTDLLFGTEDYEGVFDRLECCNRVSVEMTQRDDNDTGLAPDARHRVDVFTDGPTPTAAVTAFEYYPNWPDESAKVVLSVP